MLVMHDIYFVTKYYCYYYYIFIHIYVNTVNTKSLNMPKELLRNDIRQYNGQSHEQISTVYNIIYS
jgi:hypothetical protein